MSISQRKPSATGVSPGFLAHKIEPNWSLPWDFLRRELHPMCSWQQTLWLSVRVPTFKTSGETLACALATDSNRSSWHVNSRGGTTVMSLKREWTPMVTGESVDMTASTEWAPPTQIYRHWNRSLLFSFLKSTTAHIQWRSCLHFDVVHPHLSNDALRILQRSHSGTFGTRSRIGPLQHMPGHPPHLVIAGYLNSTNAKAFWTSSCLQRLRSLRRYAWPILETAC